MAKYIHQRPDWPRFRWDLVALSPLLADVRHGQGLLLGRMQSLGFTLQGEATLQTITLDVIQSSEIEGEHLDAGQVRSSVARRLGIDIAGAVAADRHVDGVVEMMLDATQAFDQPLTARRLCDWHASLFPAGRSGMRTIVAGAWRTNAADDPMQVVSGPLGREKVHFEAPAGERVPREMDRFIAWFNEEANLDPVLKAAVAHLWLVTIHPFDDGNGRIARAVTDMLLARADGSSRRFYSMSAEVRRQRRAYYQILESTQKGSLDISRWVEWFLVGLRAAIAASEGQLSRILAKARFWETYGRCSLNPRQRLLLGRLLDGFDGKLTTSKWAKIADCSQDTAGRDIQGLVALGILARTEGAGRSTGYWLREDGVPGASG
jgi:Fic family protein